VSAYLGKLSILVIALGFFLVGAIKLNDYLAQYRETAGQKLKREAAERRAEAARIAATQPAEAAEVTPARGRGRGIRPPDVEAQAAPASQVATGRGGRIGAARRPTTAEAAPPGPRGGRGGRATASQPVIDPNLPPPPAGEVARKGRGGRGGG
jgi:hypothetical protein